MRYSSPAAKHTTQSAENFINITELRLRLYEAISASAPGNLDAYSGFLAASSVIYKEATSELLKLRASHLASEEQRWTYGFHCAVRMPPPTILFHLREATVLLPASLFSVSRRSAHPTQPTNPGTTFNNVFEKNIPPVKGNLRKPFGHFPLGKINVDRLNFSIYKDADDVQINRHEFHDFVKGLHNPMAEMHGVVKEFCHWAWLQNLTYGRWSSHGVLMGLEFSRR